MGALSEVVWPKSERVPARGVSAVTVEGSMGSAGSANSAGSGGVA